MKRKINWFLVALLVALGASLYRLFASLTPETARVLLEIVVAVTITGIVVYSLLFWILLNVGILPQPEPGEWVYKLLLKKTKKGGEVSEYTLYVLPGSRHSKEAEELVRGSSLRVEIARPNKIEQASLRRHLDIRQLPALIGPGVQIQSLQGIRTFLASLPK